MSSRRLSTEATGDVVGLGANSVDFVHLLPGYPQPFGSFAEMRVAKKGILCGGGQGTAVWGLGAGRRVGRGALARSSVCARSTPASPAPTTTAAWCGVNWSGAASIWRT